jgi:hypothetical protein
MNGGFHQPLCRELEEKECQFFLLSVVDACKAILISICLTESLLERDLIAPFDCFLDSICLFRQSTEDANIKIVMFLSHIFDLEDGIIPVVIGVFLPPLLLSNR